MEVRQFVFAVLLFSLACFRSDSFQLQSKRFSFALPGVFRHRRRTSPNPQDHQEESSVIPKPVFTRKSVVKQPEEIVQAVVAQFGCILKQFTLENGFCRIIITKSAEDEWDTPTSEELAHIHRTIYEEFEKDTLLNMILESNQVMIRLRVNIEPN